MGGLGNFVDQSGVTRLRASGGGGGSMPVQAAYFGNAVTIPDTEARNLTWDTLYDGADLLDRTDPALPLFLTAGFYAVTVKYLSAAPLTPGGTVLAELVFPDYGGSVAASVSPAVSLNTTQGSVTAVGRVVDITQPLQLVITSHDGASSQDFSIANALIVQTPSS